VTRDMSGRSRWILVVVFAAAMAWMEAATVFYIRALVDRIDPYQAEPLPLHGALGNVELVREAATLVMLTVVGWLAGRTWRERSAYFAIAFGLWDVLYYVFLRPISGWPTTLFDWDILFLLPLPWWGPVIAPISIAVLLIVWGTLATQTRNAQANTAGRWMWALAGMGCVLALGVFMTDAFRALPGGRDAILRVLPAVFNWPVFAAALGLMALPVGFHTFLTVRSRLLPGVLSTLAGNGGDDARRSVELSGAAAGRASGSGNGFESAAGHDGLRRDQDRRRRQRSLPAER
jgi:hypothetical protein